MKNGNVYKQIFEKPGTSIVQFFFFVTNSSLLFMFKHVFLGYSFLREMLKIFMQSLFRHFDSALRCEYYLHKRFHFCFQVFS